MMSSVEGIIISAFIYSLFLMLSLPQMRCRCWPRGVKGDLTDLFATLSILPEKLRIIFIVDALKTDMKH